MCLQVDSPGTQLAKRAGVARFSPPGGAKPGKWDFEPVDFEVDTPADILPKLRRRGLDPSQRTLVLLEGVVMHLTPPAADATIRAARSLGCAGSVLVMDEVPPSAVRRVAWRPWAKLVKLLFNFTAGERFRLWGWEDDELQPYLKARGWGTVRSCVTNRDAGLAAGVPNHLMNGMAFAARIVVAEAT